MPEIPGRTEDLFQFLAPLSNEDLERLQVVLNSWEDEPEELLVEMFEYAGLLLIERKRQIGQGEL